MGVRSITFLVLVFAVAAGVIYSVYFSPPPAKPQIMDGWWGRGSPQEGDTLQETIIPFTINVDNKIIEDLKRRLKNSRFVEGLEESRFHYGFQPKFMESVIKYWQNSYDWKKEQEKINKMNHFKTNIEGLDVHFVHVKPKLKPGQKSKPIMVIHGWPGSFHEFYKIIPMLTEPTKYNGTDDDIFEVICPSIPGYGFSEAPHKKGFDHVAAARVFHKLMTRLGHKSYYVQGGDFGSIISTVMSVMYESNVRGLHINMASAPMGGRSTLMQLIGAVFPSAVVKETDRWKLYPLLDKFKLMLEESGYFHIQATKPDTIGQALNDSPMGLAAYILEKFAACINYKKAIDRDDGALSDEKISMDDMLSNVMIYWVTGTITSSMRLYKEYIHSKDNQIYESLPILIPSAIASFRYDVGHCPENFARLRHKNLVQYTDFDDGGHFAALEVPELLAGDIRSFVNKVEQIVADPK